MDNLNSRLGKHNMQMPTVQDILSHIEKPSRYLGTEINSIRKGTTSVKLKIALAFPDLYEIGTSHFGIQILYHILNQQDYIAAERVFAPAVDMEAILRARRLPLTSLESGRPLGGFDIIGFSLLYELNYTNVLNMLDLAGLPLHARRRSTAHPLVIAGGPCVCNPEPMADFFDAMLFGDGEAAIVQMALTWMEWKESKSKDRIELLKQWDRIEAVYIPQFYQVHYDQNGFQRLEAKTGSKKVIRRAIVADLEKAAFPENPIVPFGRPIHDRLRLEISRGCSRGCRFCQAGMIYRPVRERSREHLLSIAQNSLKSTGYEDLSLLSLSTGDYTCLSGLMENLMQTCESDRVALSLPSVRAGTLNPDLMNLIKKVRKTGFTIAPEAGSQRLRDAINKNISYDDVANTISDAFNMGWQLIKLYFMIGLPGETIDDIDAIAQMVKQLKNIKGPARRRGQINVSITTFIPKPHTPFQWASQISMDSSYEKLNKIKDQLKTHGVKLKFQDPAMSFLEGIMARGDRRLGAVVERVWKYGASFDGWTERFNFELWCKAFSDCNLKPLFFTSRERCLSEPLPWDHMDSGVKTAFLKRQWEASMRGQTIPDCRQGDCQQCGVCDFKEIRPRLFYTTVEPGVGLKKQGVLNVSEGAPKKVELTYRKVGQARFFGHLELANIIARAFRRAQIEVQHSQGFHPMPRIAFDNPLPLGMESDAERMRVSVGSTAECEYIMSELNRQLPKGLEIIHCNPYLKSEVLIKTDEIRFDRYRIYLDDYGDPLNGEAKINDFIKSDEWLYTRHKHKGNRQSFDLKHWVRAIRLEKQRSLYMELQRREGSLLRPSDVLSSVFKLDADAQKGLRVRKLICRNNESVLGQNRCNG